MSLSSIRYAFRHTGKWILGVVTIAMLATAYNGIGMALNSRTRDLPTEQASNPGDATVATVNGQAVTRQEYDEAYQQMVQRSQMYGQPMTPLQNGQLRTSALTQAINEDLEVQIAKQAGVKVTDADITKERDTQLTGIKTELGLKANASIDDINAKLGDGRTVDDLFPAAMLSKQIYIQKYQDMMKGSSVATDQAVQNYYRQAHTRHILISNKTRPDAQAKAQAQDIINKLKAGGDFATLAKQYSDDPGTKNKGGDDGFVGEQTGYVPEFIKAAFALQPNQVTPQPILSPQFGYFVIQTLAFKSNMPADYAKNKAKYQGQVAQSLQSQAEDAAFQAANTNAKIVVSDPLLRAYRTLQTPAPGAKPGAVDPSVLADFKSALGSADFSTKGEINAQLAQLYQQQGDTKDELDALNAALANTEDPQLRLMLGDALRKSGDSTKALAQYKEASSDAYNNPSIHMQLQQTYKQMQQPQLAAVEAQWFKDYAKSQQQARATSPMMGGGQPIKVTPNSAPVTVKK